MELVLQARMGVVRARGGQAQHPRQQNQGRRPQGRQPPPPRQH
jgi:hypothetical protein